MDPDRSLSIVSWNVANDADFQRLQLQETALGSSHTSDLIEGDIPTFRDQLIKKIFMDLNASVYCVQEIGDDADRVKRCLDPQRYEFYSSDGHDTGIIWDKNRFECLEKHELKDKYSAEYTIVLLKDRLTDNVIRVASTHLTSCEPDYPVESDAQTGNDQLANLISQLDHMNKERKADAVVLGMDANTFRSYAKRIDIAREQGYVVDNNQYDTVNNYKRSKIGKCDYVAIKSLKKNAEFIPSEVPNIPLQDTRFNPSDHLPDVTRVALTSKGIFKRILGL